MEARSGLPDYTKEWFEEFNKVVNSELRGNATPQLAGWLRSDEIVDDWIACLKCIRRSLDAQLTQKRAELYAKTVAKHGNAASQHDMGDLAVYYREKHAIVRVRNAVEARLQEGRRLTA